MRKTRAFHGSRGAAAVETFQAEVNAPFLTFALRWGGSKWQQASTPNGPDPTGVSNLSSVAVLPSGAAWAVGTTTPATGCCERVLTARNLHG